MEGTDPNEIPERTARLIGRVDETASIPECPSCGANDWDYGAFPLALPKVAPNPEGKGLEVFPYICTHCGFVRLYSTDHLENPRHPDH